MKFGKKNKVNTNPLSYFTCLLGESKCGKTTLTKQVCEKLVGDEGYMFLEIGQERGADAIEGINYVNCPEWNMEYDELTNSAGFADVCDDILENKNEKYPDLKVLIWDTYDQLIDIAEDEALRLWNKECREQGHPEKRAKTINGAWGGFGKGEKKAIELMFDYRSKLKLIGVETFVIGHVKTKTISDVVTGETYEKLTSDQQQNYFNALKKNLHFLALAYIDREIVKDKKAKKKGNDDEAGKIVSETRKIKFRDDNYAVDSGSRFSDIVPEIEMSADNFITALKDAIEAEIKNGGSDLKKREKESKKIEAEVVEHSKELEAELKEKGKLDAVLGEIIEFIKDNRKDVEKLKPIAAKAKELGYENPTKITDYSHAVEVLELIKAM